MKEFKKYKRKQIAELRPVTDREIEIGEFITIDGETEKAVSVSQADLENGSPKKGDMVARNPRNHRDQWLVAAQYFQDNFEPHNEG